MTPTERILAALQERDCNPRRAGKGWSARCPAHEDRRASLSIAEGHDGRALVNCHAGCAVDAVCAAVGLKPADLFTPSTSTVSRPTWEKRENRRQDNGKPVRTTFATAQGAVAELERRHGPRSALWTYHDAHGQPVGVVVRWDLADGRKDIRPVSRHGDGWQIGGMPSPRPLYGLSDLAGSKRVYVGEGEKAVDAARSIGLTATTSAHGSQSPDKTDWAPLAGKEIVILPDNDRAGSQYADAVAAHLAKLTPAPVVKVVELPDLPEHGDIVEWIGAHGDAAEPADLRRQLEAAADQAEVTQLDRLRERIEPIRPFGRDVDVPDMADPWPDPLDEAAFHGVAGELVRAIEPHSEADPVALLASILAAFGNVIGRTAHFRAEADLHYGNLFTCLVGSTSKGRKGTSWGQAARVFDTVDPDWLSSHVVGGLSSGEGLIWAVRDPIYRHEAVREGKGKSARVVGYQDVEVDPGVADKRLLVLESEFSSVLKVILRERNTLSAIIRQAWDRGNLATLTKNSPAKATGAHISIIGHITRNELKRLITETDLANGLANRFLWLCVRRSKCLPEGGAIHTVDFREIDARLNDAVEFAGTTDIVQRDQEAREVWCEVYPRLSEGQPGLLGAATSRAEAQVMRLAMLYALLDCSPLIRPDHLLAALAVWTYAEQSARYVFGSALGDPTADAILQALRNSPDGLTREEIRKLFSGNRPAEEIARALAVLVEGGLARHEPRETGGRPAEVWFHIG